MSPAASRLRRGSRLGKYRLDRQIGRGSFATVWRARDTVERRFVALKVAHPEFVAEVGRDELEHEAQIGARLEHPNIVAIRNADWIGNTFVIAADLAERCLADYAGARRSGAIALRVVRDAAAGLAHAHAERVMHRDVKPENILIFRDGHAALADFGVSRFSRDATRTYTEAGTLGYMAPEQAYGRPKLTSDVFSLGLIAYELLAGKLPTWPFEWPGPGYERFARRVPAPLRPVLEKAASFEPTTRYADAVEFHEALEAAFAKIESPPPRRKMRRRKASRPKPTPLAVEAAQFKRQHAKGLAMNYQCHRCDGPISESMLVCPWCGSNENSFREVTSYTLYCPDCERGVRAEWTACPWCYSGRLEGNGRTPRPDPKAERSCSNRGCDGELQPFMRYCPRCKQKPRRPWTHAELPDRCPRCRWSVSKAWWRYCPWCGRREPRAGTFSGRR